MQACVLEVDQLGHKLMCIWDFVQGEDLTTVPLHWAQKYLLYCKIDTENM